MSHLDTLKKARKVNPNDHIHSSKEIQIENPDTEEEKKGLFGTFTDNAKKFWSAKQDRGAVGEKLPEESCANHADVSHNMDPKTELCQKSSCFSSLLDVTADYCMKGIMSDERGTPAGLVSSWKYALGDGRCPALSEVLTEIESDVKTAHFNDELPTERRILLRWYSYLCYKGLERLCYVGETICINSARRFEFNNSNQFKDNTMCVVKKSSWYCDSVLLVQGVLGEIAAKADLNMIREERRP